MEKKERKLIIDICRIALGAVFVFSGFMKCIDTWGTAQKVGDYLTAFGFDWLLGMQAVLAVILSAFELTMGLMLVFKVRPKLMSLVAFVFMIGFTLLTLWIAIWNPLDDCGCFGEALRISNWNSFFKNVVLLALSIVVWRFNREGRFFAFTRKEILLTVLFLAVSAITGALVYRHLPPVDMFPYKTGTNLREDVVCTACMDDGTVLVYKDLETGRNTEFSLSDTTWYDSARWEYVETRNAADGLTPEMLEEDFALYWGDINMADEVIEYKGNTILIVLRNKGAAGEKCLAKIETYLAGQQDARKIVIIEKKSGFSSGESVFIGGEEIPVLSMEPKPLGYLLRADAGIVTVKDGVITGKKNCRDVR